MKYLLVAIAALLLGYSPAQAASCQGQAVNTTLCSKIVTFSGNCGVPIGPDPSLADVVGLWAPWEPSPIIITDVALDIFVAGGTFIQAFVGNSYTPDPMTGLSYALQTSPTGAVLRDRMPYPSGGMGLPGSNAPNYHIDVHMTCAPYFAPFQGSVVLWYPPL